MIATGLRDVQSLGRAHGGACLRDVRHGDRPLRHRLEQFRRGGRAVAGGAEDRHSRPDLSGPSRGARAAAPAQCRTALGASGAAHSMAPAIAKNPYTLIVPCHRVLETRNYADRPSPYSGVVSKRRLLALEGAHPVASKTLFEVLLPVAPPQPGT